MRGKSAGIPSPMAQRMRWVWLMVLLPLAACSGAPGDADVQAALERHFVEAVAPAQAKFGAQAGAALVPTVQSVVLQSCAAREGGLYLCEAQVSLHSKVLGQRQSLTRLLLTQDANGWRVLSQL